MACRESRGTRILLYFGLFLFSVLLCNCARLTRLKALNKLGGNSMLSQYQAKQGHGRLLIGQNPLHGAKANKTKAANNFMDVKSDYQADMGWGETRHPHMVAMERLFKMEPKVECTLDSMKLQIHNAAATPGSLFFVDRGSHLSPLPLSNLPSSCGYTIKSTRSDLVLVVPYDGCFVVLEEDSYVLPLRWWELPLRMSCPLMSPLSLTPPSVTCNAEGMAVKTEWMLPVSKIKIKLNGNWEPLVKVSNRCGFSTIEHPEGVVISVQYAPCLEKEDGLYTLEVAGDGEAKISCPSQLPVQPQSTKNPAKEPDWQSETPSRGVFPPTFPRDPDQPLKPAELVVPQVQGLPQNLKMPNKKPNQGLENTDKPQLSYHPFYPTFFYPYSTTPAERSLTPIHSSAPVIQTAMDTKWQNFFPSHSQPPQAKINHREPMTKLPAGRFEEHWFANPFNPLPSLLQKPVPSPASQSESKEQKPLYPQSAASEAPSVESPLHAQHQNLPEKPGLPQAPQPEAQTQIYQPFYFYPLYPQPKPEIQPDTKPTTVPQPPQPEAPQPQVHQITYLCPENQLARNPNVALMSETETLLGQVHKLCQQSEVPAGRNDDTDPTEIPSQSAQPPVKHPQGQTHHITDQFYSPQQPQLPQPVTLPPITYIQQQVTASDDKYVESAVPQTSNSDTVPQVPQFSSVYMQPVYCPQFCFSGFPNCCPQIAFYQHLHISPAGLGSKDVHQFDVGSARFSPKPTEAAMPQSATTHTSAPISEQPSPFGNAEQPYLQPPDGNTATQEGSNPIWTANPEPLLHYNSAPNSLYSYWPYLPQSQSPGHHSEVPKSPASSNDPVNPVAQYELSNIKSPVQPNRQLLNNPWPDFISISQNSEQHQNKPPEKELHQFVVPYYMLHHASVPSYNSSVVPDNSKPQPFISDSEKSKHQQGLNLYSEPENYVLLQHGSSGREPTSFMDSSVLFRDLSHDVNFAEQNLARDQNAKHQIPPNLTPLEEKTQLSKSQEEGMLSPLPGGVSYERRHGGDDDDRGDDSDVPLLSPAWSGPPPVFPPFKPPFSAAHLDPKFQESFKDLSRTLTPLGSKRRFPPHIPRRMFQQWSSAADH